MMLQVDASAALPVYEQIREQVVRMVLAGTLAPGTRLPTIRQLANDLQLAKGTVAKAYSILEESDVIETRGHRGSFILAPPAEARADRDARDELGEAADAYVVAARQLGIGLASATEELARRWDRF